MEQLKINDIGHKHGQAQANSTQNRSDLSLAFTGFFQHIQYVCYSSVNVSSVMLDGVQTGGAKGGSKERIGRNIQAII